MKFIDGADEGLCKTIVFPSQPTENLQLVRINLSEQTDISDLFGSDLPVADTTDSQVATDGSSIEEETLQEGVDGGSGGTRFAWCDGVFLRALKEGKWVLLDELNLATQVTTEEYTALGRRGTKR